MKGAARRAPAYQVPHKIGRGFNRFEYKRLQRGRVAGGNHRRRNKKASGQQCQQTGFQRSLTVGSARPDLGRSGLAGSHIVAQNRVV